MKNLLKYGLALVAVFTSGRFFAQMYNNDATVTFTAGQPDAGTVYEAGDMISGLSGTWNVGTDTNEGGMTVPRIVGEFNGSILIRELDETGGRVGEVAAVTYVNADGDPSGTFTDLSITVPADIKPSSELDNGHSYILFLTLHSVSTIITQGETGFAAFPGLATDITITNATPPATPTLAFVQPVTIASNIVNGQPLPWGAPIQLEYTNFPPGDYNTFNQIGDDELGMDNNGDPIMGGDRFSGNQIPFTIPDTNGDGSVVSGTIEIGTNPAERDVMLAEGSTVSWAMQVSGQVSGETIKIGTNITVDNTLSATNFEDNISGTFYVNSRTQELVFDSQIQTDSVTIYSLSGTKIKEAIGHTISVAELSRGIYFVVTDQGASKFAK